MHSSTHRTPLLIARPLLCATLCMLSCGDDSRGDSTSHDDVLTRSQAQLGPADDFVMTWDTRLSTSFSNDHDIQLTIMGTYDVDWDGDGIFDSTGVSGPSSHVYPTPGVYTVRLRSASALRMYFPGPVGECEKLVSVDQWGTIPWSSMENMFSRCTNLDSFPVGSTPNMTGVTNMSSMFNAATIFNQPIGDWDTSRVTNMSRMFNSARAFNQPLDNWDTSSVTRMDTMFNKANAFNQPIGSWDVSNVTDMSSMFSDTLNFNQSIASWDVSSVTDTSQMFKNARAFNQPIGGWDVSAVTTMERMFENAGVFDQDLGGWEIAAVTNMTNMLDDTNLSTINYDNTLMGWALQDVSPNVTVNAVGLTYCAGASARQNLTTQDMWTITDGGSSCLPTDQDGDGVDASMDTDDTDPCQPDPIFRSCPDIDVDGDGLTLAQETTAMTNPNRADSDGDGLCDGTTTIPGVCITGEDALSALDSDQDMILDALDPDDDGDGIDTRDEDTDGDGDPTNDIGANGPRYLDPCEPDPQAVTCPTGDTDGDLVLNGSDSAPLDPCVPDMTALTCIDDNGDEDHDGIDNATELAIMTDPFSADSDGDGLCDGGIAVAMVCQAGEFAHANQDTDGDMLLDALDPDDDNDGVDTAQERALGLSPHLADSDGDGLCDGPLDATGCSAGPDPRNNDTCISGRPCDLPTASMCLFDDSCASRYCTDGVCVPCRTNADCQMNERCQPNPTIVECVPSSPVEDMGMMGDLDMGTLDDMDMSMPDDMAQQDADMMPVVDMSDEADMNLPAEDMAQIQDMNLEDMPTSNPDMHSSDVPDMSEPTPDMSLPRDMLTSEGDMATSLPPRNPGRPDVNGCSTTHSTPNTPAPLAFLLSLLGLLGLKRRETTI